MRQRLGAFSVFEWLNDDTLAMIGPTGWDDATGYGDILTCRLSDGHCDLTALGRGPVRVEAKQQPPRLRPDPTGGPAHASASPSARSSAWPRTDSGMSGRYAA